MALYYDSHYKGTAVYNVYVYFLGLGAAVTLYVHVGNKRRKWDSYPEALKFYMLLGCFIQLAGVCGFVTYLALGITNHQGTVTKQINH